MGIVADKAVVITGAGRGIGRGHAQVLASEGACVVVNDVDLDVARETAAELEAAGGRAIASGDDVGTRAGCEALIGSCVAAFGRIDALVNNAGIVRDRSFLKMTDADFDDVFRVHARSTFWCAQAAGLRMREQGGGGAIVNTTSGAHFGNFGQTNYAAAKGAIASMTYTWALELARYGIRVNAIAPGGSTRMTQTARDADGNEIDMPYWDPALNGPLVAYLVSDEGDWVTGQVFACGMDRLGVMVQPKYGTMLQREGGWDVESVRAAMQGELRDALEPFGLAKQPYAFHDGVKPRR